MMSDAAIVIRGLEVVVATGCYGRLQKGPFKQS
jgi:hypothetical protein